MTATAESYLACGPCKASGNEVARQLWNCGFAPRLPNHRGEYPLPGGAARPSDDTCPGYLIALPQIAETARAYGWWDKGQLTEHCDGEPPTALLRDCIDTLHLAVGDLLAERRKEKPGG